MPLRFGTSEVSLRLGSQVVEDVFIGSILATTFAPGAPTITNAGQDLIPQGGILGVYFTAPADDGDSAITSYRVYVDGQQLPTQDFEFVDENDYTSAGPYTISIIETGGSLAGTSVEIAAVNSVGEGPKSNEIVPQ